ncbi:MAG: FUSC family protein [Gordonia sp. (in: high G+C Gram-positive bacteria)]
MGERNRIVGRWMAAVDPGRVRLRKASSVAAAVLVSATIALLLVRSGHIDGGVLSMSAFLALFAGSFVRDTTTHARTVTTVLLPAPIVAGLTAATAVHSLHYVEAACFILLAGAAIWVQRYGARATTLGAMAYFGFAYGMILRPDWHDLPQFYLIAVTAILSLLAVQLPVYRDRPRTELALLLAELRAAAANALARAVHAKPSSAPVTTPAAAIAAAPRNRVPAALNTRLTRIDDVARAIKDWQSRNATDRTVDCTSEQLATQVLDARIGVIHICLEVSDRLRAGGTVAPESTLQDSLDDLAAVVAPQTADDDVEEAAARAEQRAGASTAGSEDGLAVAVADRAVVAHAALRRLDLTKPLDAAPAHADAGKKPAAASPVEPKPESKPKRADGPPWKRWQPTTRTSIQVMIAAAVAAAVGDLLSADRWYWAVMTAFAIFASTNNRAAVLAKAWRRGSGTLAGVIVGFALAFSLSGHPPALIAMCALSVFCTLYFGPLNYVWQAFFLTLVVATLFGLLGVLTPHVLELRLVETLIGAVVGVGAAYLIFSTSSRPDLLRLIDKYFEAIDELLSDVHHTLTDGADHDAAVTAFENLDAAHSALRKNLDAVDAGVLIARHAGTGHLEDLMTTTTRIAGELARWTAATPVTTDGSDGPPPTARFGPAVDHVRASSSLARAALVHDEHRPVDPSETAVLDTLATSSNDRPEAEVGIALSLSSLNWALLRAAAITADQDRGGRRPPDSSGTLEVSSRRKAVRRLQ